MALHRTGLVLASLALLFGAAACGGGGDAAPPTGSEQSGGGPGGPGGTAMNAYFECLQKNGVTITRPSRGARPSGQPRPSGGPRPGGGGLMGGKPDGVDDATWEKAQAACASVRPSFGPGGGNGRGGRGQMSPAYRNCLQEHGATFGSGASAPPDDATLRKAREACEALAPTPRPSS
ncbi:hypothetical protein [Actinoplanes sp. NPDC049265]|uniref:hypothetical protein n=1 Tax=Actinoplanes sp. NPDC049265 TaxID=3363902 RepID=UPI00371DA1CC